jgi:hypothetical protein
MNRLLDGRFNDSQTPAGSAGHCAMGLVIQHRPPDRYDWIVFPANPLQIGFFIEELQIMSDQLREV